MKIPMTTPSQLATAVPYLAGFVPEKSIVIVTMHENSGDFERGLIARQNIPTTAAETQRALESFASGYLNGGQGATHAAIIIFDDITAQGSPDAQLPHIEHAQVIQAGLEELGITSVASIYVNGDQVGIYGQGGMQEITESERDLVDAHFVFQGITAPEASGDFETSIRYNNNTVIADLIKKQYPHLGATIGGEQASDDALAIAATLKTAHGLTNDDIAFISVGLHNIYTRDTVLWDMATDDSLASPNVLARLGEVVANTPDEFVAPVATTLAIGQWVSCDGRKANRASQRAHLADPNYGLNKLIAASLEHGLPPQMWKESLAELQRDQCAGITPSPATSHQERGQLGAQRVEQIVTPPATRGTNLAV